MNPPRQSIRGLLDKPIRRQILLCLFLASVPLTSSFQCGGFYTGAASRSLSSRARGTILNVNVPDAIDSLDFLFSSMDNSILLSKDVSTEDLKGLAKAAVIFLAFGGGLIPATISANGALISKLNGSEKKDDNYVSSEAVGPKLPLSELLFVGDTIPLVDIIAIVGRIKDVDSIADWRNLPSAKAPGVSENNPPMWLGRDSFKKNIRALKFSKWPLDSKGDPIGGEALAKEETRRVSGSRAVIGDAALNAVFDTWSWGANIATPDKVDKQLTNWKNGDEFDLNGFASAAVFGRANTLLAAFSFIILQLLTYNVLFIAPILRQIFDVDIGFGTIGQCSSECVRLFI